MTNSVMQGNYSHDNQGSGYGVFQFTGARPFHNNVVRYNISQDDGGGVYLWDGVLLSAMVDNSNPLF
jgi:hypothetical protein